MKKLLFIILLFISFASFSQVSQQFGAVADNLDSLTTHVGRNHQYVVILNVQDSTGGLYYYDSSSLATEIPNKVFKVTGRDTGRWFFVKYFNTNSLALQTNDVPNGNQNLLDLVSGSNISLFDFGDGTVLISASAPPLTWEQTLSTQGSTPFSLNHSVDMGQKNLQLFNSNNFNFQTNNPSTNGQGTLNLTTNESDIIVSNNVTHTATTSSYYPDSINTYAESVEDGPQVHILNEQITSEYLKISKQFISGDTTGFALNPKFIIHTDSVNEVDANNVAYFDNDTLKRGHLTGGGGGSTLFALTGTNTATGDVMGDLSGGHILAVSGTVGNFLQINTNAGEESAAMEALGTEIVGASSQLILNNNSDNGYKFNLSAYDGTNTVNILGDAAANTITYTAATHTFNGGVLALLGTNNFEVDDGTGAGNLLFVINPSSFLNQLTATDGASASEILMNADGRGSNVNLLMEANDSTGLNNPKITLDALSNSIIFGDNNHNLNILFDTLKFNSTANYGVGIIKTSGGLDSLVKVPFGGGGSGTVTSIATTSPITGGTITTTGTIGINNAAADGSTKGAASFTANDFDASSGNISIDYTNGQAATTSLKGFLTSTDWNTFNGKLSPSGSGTGLSGVALLASANTLTANNIFQPTVSTGTGTTAGIQVVANSLTTGNGIDASSSSITTGNLLKLTSTSTVGNSFSLLNISSSGANGTASKTATGETISVINTGTTNTNVGLNVTASGATNNYAALFTGKVGIGVSSPSYPLDVTGDVHLTGLLTADDNVSAGHNVFLPFAGGFFLNAYPNGGMGLRKVTTNTLALVTNTTDQLIVDASGNTSLAANLTLSTAGSKLVITEGTNGRVGQTVLVSGTKAITISGLTTSSRAFVQLVSPSGVTLTTSYQAVCTSNTLTIQANVAAGTINVSDGSTLNYFIIN